MSSYIDVFLELDYVTLGSVIEVRSNVRRRYGCNEWENRHQGQKNVFQSTHRGFNKDKEL